MQNTLDTDVAQRLNESCHCVGVNREELEGSLFRGMADAELVRSLSATHRHLFSSSPVFVAESHLATMQGVVDAIEELAQLEGFRQRADARLRAAGLEPPANSPDALLSYDFHVAENGPQLIEVNTNPGGVLLGLHIQAAQQACCDEVARAQIPLATQAEVEAALIEMVSQESTVSSANVAIVDERPTEQFLYPEFVLYRQLFERHAVSTRILDPRDLEARPQGLRHGDWPIGWIYNRSTDFLFEQTESGALRAAWQSAQVAATPDPVVWSRFADKENLVLLRDAQALSELGLSEPAAAHLEQAVPSAQLLSQETAADLWDQRKQHFFKPAAGHGSRGTYDGKKISRRKFEELLGLRYIAQRRIPPSMRTLLVDETEVSLKLDLRCITWRGRVLMLMARMYRGQTTNMRTEGGGLATALVFSTETN